MNQDSANVVSIGAYCFSSFLILSERDVAFVHPDDLLLVQQKYPTGWQLMCFRYGGRQNGYDILDDGESRIKVRDAIIRPIPTPRFNRNQHVFAHPKQTVGVIRQVLWHLKRNCVYYSLEFDGRLSGRWYFEPELTLPGDELRQAHGGG